MLKARSADRGVLGGGGCAGAGPRGQGAECKFVVTTLPQSSLAGQEELLCPLAEACLHMRSACTSWQPGREVLGVHHKHAGIRQVCCQWAHALSRITKHSTACLPRVWPTTTTPPRLTCSQAVGQLPIEGGNIQPILLGKPLVLVEAPHPAPHLQRRRTATVELGQARLGLPWGRRPQNIPSSQQDGQGTSCTGAGRAGRPCDRHQCRTSRGTRCCRMYFSTAASFSCSAAALQGRGAALGAGTCRGAPQYEESRQVGGWFGARQDAHGQPAPAPAARKPITLCFQHDPAESTLAPSSAHTSTSAAPDGGSGASRAAHLRAALLARWMMAAMELSSAPKKQMPSSCTSMHTPTSRLDQGRMSP